jgi:hypothetical protein
MKKITLIIAITMGLALNVSAGKKYKSHSSSHNSYNNHNSHSSNHNSHSNHSSHNSHNSSHSSRHYTYVTKKIWVPGCSQRVWVPSRYEYRRQHCGTIVRVCVSHGHYDTRYSQGHYDYRQVRVQHGSHQRHSGVNISWRF